MMKFHFLLLVLATESVHASQESPFIRPSDIFTGDYLLQVAGSFFLVIAVLLGVLFFLKRSNTVTSQSVGGLHVVSSISLGQRERAILLQVGDEQLLVGVTAQSIQPLHVLSKPVSIQHTSSGPAFLDVWKAVIGRQEGFK